MDTRERAIAVKARMTALKALHLPLTKPCTDCRFGPIDGSGVGRCEHFVHWEVDANPVTGKRRGRASISTNEARSDNGLCGQEGLLFEPYTRGGKVARWLAQWLSG